MSIRPYWEYYKGCFPFLFAIGILVTIAFGFVWGILCYMLLGPYLSGRAFQAFRNNEYVFYYNLGITKWKLLKTTFFINLIIAVPVAIILYVLASNGVGFSGT